MAGSLAQGIPEPDGNRAGIHALLTVSHGVLNRDKRMRKTRRFRGTAIDKARSDVRQDICHAGCARRYGQAGP